MKALYESLPAMRCGGDCWDSCGPIDMSTLERRTIKKETGQEIPLGMAIGEVATVCPQLTFLKRCRIYEHRPLICRLWGLTESLKCPYGCVPEGGYLTDEDAFVLFNRAWQISGDPYVPEDAVREAFRNGMARLAAEHSAKARAQGRGRFGWQRVLG